MATFYTSDLHHAHKNILKFTERKYVTDVDNHTQWLIDIWNSQVQHGDIVYHLGDLSFSSSYNKVSEFISQLNGQIHLIHGNHDNISLFKKLKEENLIAWHGTYKETKQKDTKICLFHYPIMAWNHQHHGSWHLFGHCHSTYTPDKGKSLDVGLDNAYKLFGEHHLFTEQDIADYMSNRPIYTPDHHKKQTT